MTSIHFIILILATWRITNILTEEDGPFDLNKKLRMYFFAGEFDPMAPDFDNFSDEDMEWWTSRKVIPEQGFFGKLLSCALCTSVWVGAGLGWLSISLPTVTFFIAIPFALSAASLIVGELYGLMEPKEE